MQLLIKLLKEEYSLDNEIFLSITVYPHLLNSFPRFITYLPYSLLIKPKLKTSLVL